MQVTRQRRVEKRRSRLLGQLNGRRRLVQAGVASITLVFACASVGSASTQQFGHQQFGAWPTNDNQHLVTVMQKRDRFAEFRADVDGNFQKVFDEIMPEKGAELRDKGVRAERFRPMRYPDNYYRRSAGPGWALVGDAGYHKDPFTGWGISDALKYAGLLAGQLHAGLSGEQPIDAAVAEYERLRDAETESTFQFTCMISELEMPPFYDAVFRAAAESELGNHQFFAMIGGGLHGPDFFGRENREALYSQAGTPRDQRLYAN